MNDIYLRGPVVADFVHQYGDVQFPISGCIIFDVRIVAFPFLRADFHGTVPKGARRSGQRPSVRMGSNHEWVPTILAPRYFSISAFL